MDIQKEQISDLEFSKLQKKIIKATDVSNEKYSEKIDTNDVYIVY